MLFLNDYVSGFFVAWLLRVDPVSPSRSVSPSPFTPLPSWTIIESDDHEHGEDGDHGDGELRRNGEYEKGRVGSHGFNTEQRGNGENGFGF